MKLKPLPESWLAKDPRRAMLAAYVNALGDLAGPKRALPMLQDTARLNAYAAGIRHALLQRPGQPPPLCPLEYAKHGIVKAWIEL